MTQREYAAYLGRMLAIEVDSNADDLHFQFYGLFQSFMPSGKGLRKVFEPVEDGDAYFERLIEIYSYTEGKFKELAAEGQTPAYFCPPPQLNRELLAEHAEKYIANVRSFAPMLNDPEFTETMEGIKGFEIIDINSANTRRNENDTNIIIHEALSDWFIGHANFSSLLSVLNEAYYSINCDYFLSYYFQYPAYASKLKLDIFKPYFEVWKLGYYCWFDTGRLVIGK